MIMTIINCLLSGFVTISTSTAQHGELLQITGFSKISAHFIPNVIYCEYECHGGKGTIWRVNLSSTLCSRCSKKNIVLMKVVLSVYMVHVVSLSPFQTPPISCFFTHPVLSLNFSLSFLVWADRSGTQWGILALAQGSSCCAFKASLHCIHLQCMLCLITVYYRHI